MTKVLYAGDLVDDFYGARVPIDLLLQHGIKASAEYLKAWDDPYTQQLRDAGIAPIAIGEQGAGDALLGATLGQRNGILWCNLADMHGYPVDDPVGIVVCHDTGLYNSLVPEYFKAAEDVIRGRGRCFSGYIMKNPANSCMAAGVRFDVIWATAALSWGGGPHPWSHVQQKPSSIFPGTGMRVDMGVVLRPFNVWSATPPPIVSLGGSIMLVHNAETTIANDANGNPVGYPPGAVKWTIESDGHGGFVKRHLSPATYALVSGAAEGALTNAQLTSIPDAA